MVTALADKTAGTYEQMSQRVMPYGNGTASPVIVATLGKMFQDDSVVALQRKPGGDLDKRPNFICEDWQHPTDFACHKKGEVSVVLTVYKRDNLLYQLQSLAAQSEGERFASAWRSNFQL